MVGNSEIGNNANFHSKTYDIKLFVTFTKPFRGPILANPYLGASNGEVKPLKA